MRLVLAIESSSRTYAVAAGAGERPQATFASRRDDPTFLGVGDLAARALAASEATFSDIETIAVDIGPGGLSSIRAAVAYANGLAFSLGVQVFPMTSLELMAIAAEQAHRGPRPCLNPLLCLKRGQGGNAYAGLFVNGEAAELLHGPPGSVVPALAAALQTVRVAGMAAGDVAGLLPGVAVEDTGIPDADVTVLYQAARAAGASADRLAAAAVPVNEASLLFRSLP